MSFFNIFRNLFGGNIPDEPKHEPNHDRFDNHQSHRHNFRNPIWQNGDDDDDDDSIGDFRHFGTHVIFNDPSEIMHHFESQIHHLLKHLNFNFSQDEKYINIIPFEAHGPKKENNLRDQMLKPNFDQPHDSVVPYGIINEVDVDLDEKTNKGSASRIWDRYKNSLWSSPVSPPTTSSIEPSASQFHSVGKCMQMSVIRRSDGTVEHKKVIKDTEGNEEITVSRNIGDKTHVVKIKKDKDGNETTTTDLINMDEQEFKDFNQKWGPTILSDGGSKL